MTQQATSMSRVLHAVRLLGFADSAAIVRRADTDLAEDALREAERRGWVQHVTFADVEGWSLTEGGKAENERRLAREREDADPDRVIEAVYRSFLPLNARFLSACTDWQIKPAEGGRFTPNDHGDRAWDDRVLRELAALAASLEPLNRRLRGVLARFRGYDTRFNAALAKAESGRHDWIDRTNIDSCHRVWFQLHEDLVASLGIDRGAEAARRDS